MLGRVASLSFSLPARIASGDARHGPFAVPGLKMILSRDEDIGVRVEVEERSAPLFDEMVRYDHHALFDEADASRLHCSCRHDPRLAGTDAMGEQRAVALQDAPDSILLMRGKIGIAQD